MLEWLRDLFTPVLRVERTGSYVAAQPNLLDVNLRQRAHVYGITAANVGLAETTEHILGQTTIIWGISSVQVTGAQTGTNWYIDYAYDAAYTEPFQIYPNNITGSLTGYMGGTLAGNLFPMVLPGGTRIRMRSAVAAGAYTFRNSLLITEI